MRQYWVKGPLDADPVDPQLFESDYEGVEYMAEDYYDNHDGWEDKWPLIFVVLEDGKEVERFQVGMEAEPAFYASPVRKES